MEYHKVSIVYELLPLLGFGRRKILLTPFVLLQLFFEAAYWLVEKMTHFYI